MAHTLTTIEVQGTEESVFEVYADETREQTLGYALEEKNAVLWANAPEMLAALREAYFQFEHNGEESDSDKDVLDQVQAAIAKATGK